MQLFQGQHFTPQDNDGGVPWPSEEQCQALFGMTQQEVIDIGSALEPLPEVPHWLNEDNEAVG